jgi:hypothetical protein
MCLPFFFICSPRVNASAIVLSESLCERIGKWGTWPILKEERSLVRVYLEHLLQKCPLLSVSRGTVFKVMSAYTNNGKTTSAKRNSERKSTLTKRDRRTLRRIVSKNHTTTAAHVNCIKTEYSS